MSFRLDFDPELVEEAVLLGVQGSSEARRFRGVRDAIYELVDAEEREKRFQQVHRQWFLRLGMSEPISKALEEQPGLLQKTRDCSVLRVSLRKKEGADLHGTHPKMIGLRLRADSLLQGRVLRSFLRHEFTHLARIIRN